MLEAMCRFVTSTDFHLCRWRNTRLFRFNDYSVVLQAAIKGQGVAMGWRHQVDLLIEQGLLVRPVLAASLLSDQARIWPHDRRLAAWADDLGSGYLAPQAVTPA